MKCLWTPQAASAQSQGEVSMGASEALSWDTVFQDDIRKQKVGGHGREASD